MARPESEVDLSKQDQSPDNAPDNPSDNFFINILTGDKERVSPRKLLIQKVLRQLIESYGFDRNDIQVGFNPKIPGQGRKTVDIAVFRPGTEHSSDTLQRIIICKTQKKRDKLRSLAEAEPDLRNLKELMALIPGASLGMWTNGQEEFLLQVEHTRFDVLYKPLGIWPAPGESTDDVDKTGGVIQVGADAQDLEDALLRAHRYINRNLQDSLLGGRIMTPQGLNFPPKVLC